MTQKNRQLAVLVLVIVVHALTGLAYRLGFLRDTS